MKALRRSAKILLTVMCVAPLVIAADAASAGQRLAPFSEFIASVAAAQPTPQAKGAPEAKVEGALADASALARRKSYLGSIYASVDAKAVKHSFVDPNETVFDCIPTSQQPALRGSTAPLPTPPELPVMGRARPKGPAAAASGADPAGPLSLDQKDRFGNAMACAAGTIPMARVTLETLARFPSVEAFLRKGPDGAGLPPLRTIAQPLVAATHRYAHAYQFANNLGGHSYLNLWDPPIGGDQIFSLSQHWYVGGSGGNLQTAEVGWQVYPQLYGTTKPVFFIYWTADGYTNTGCYNLTCGAFVQINRAWPIGGAINYWSRLNGAQYEVEVTFYLFRGNWWLFVNGAAIGYYPTGIYNGGALSNYATEIDYGGEVVGATSWPPMGSGQFASAGFQKAAYQRFIYYFPATGGAAFATLTSSQNWPADYTALIINYPSPFFETLFYGGPGGTR